MKAFWESLAGRKTYLLSGGLMIGVIVLVFMGIVSPTEAVGLVFMAGFASTFRGALAKHHAAALAVLADVAAAGVAARQNNKDAEMAAIEQIGADAIRSASAASSKVIVLILLLASAGTLRAQTGCVVRCGCVSSPELPTGILALVGAVAFGLCAWIGYQGRKKEKGC